MAKITTTIRIEDDLHIKVKKIAAERKTDVSDIISCLLVKFTKGKVSIDE